MGRTVAVVKLPRSMRDRTPTFGGLPSGALTAAAPRARAKLELLHDARHLIRADIYTKLVGKSRDRRMPSRRLHGLACPGSLITNGTSLVVARRLSTIRRADLIAVVPHGRSDLTRRRIQDCQGRRPTDYRYPKRRSERSTIPDTVGGPAGVVAAFAANACLRAALSARCAVTRSCTGN